MGLNLSAADVRQLKKAIEVLVSPFDHPNVDGWRSAVNSEMKTLLRADSAGFMLPETGSLFLYSDEHDPAELSKYPDLMPPSLLDGQNPFVAMSACRVNTLERLYAEGWDRYLSSEYYNEYAGANGAHDTLAALLPMEEAGIAGLQFWHDHPTRSKFTQREIDLLEIVYPVIRSSILTYLGYARHASQLTTMVDELTDAMLVYDGRGKLLHQTPAASALLASDPDAELIRAAAERVVVSKNPAHVLTQRGRYQINSFNYNRSREKSLVVVVVKRDAPVALTDEELQLMFRLTAAEIRVARELANGSSNLEIAEVLRVSAHTVKRHAEKVFQKLGVKTRGEVWPKLYIRS